MTRDAARDAPPIVTDRRHEFARAPEEVWSALADTDRYTTWWPWLREFDGTALTPGSTWTCAVRSPFGYRVRFTVRLDHVDPPRSVHATISGDIDGRAAVLLAPSDPHSGSQLRITSHLAPRRPLLRVLTRLAPGVARRGHDHIMRSGVESFRTHAIRDR